MLFVLLLGVFLFSDVQHTGYIMSALRSLLRPSQHVVRSIRAYSMLSMAGLSKPIISQGTYYESCAARQFWDGGVPKWLRLSSGVLPGHVRD